MNAQDNDWKGLAADWQAQDAPTLDIRALRRESRRRGFWLRFTVISETVLTLLTLAACVAVAAQEAAAGSVRAMLLGLGFLLVVYQGAMVWLRRHQWSDAGLEADALLALEIRRARTVVLYWRWGMWTCVLLWLGVYAYFLAGVRADWPARVLDGWLGALGVNVLLIPLMGAYGAWRCRRALARATRFQALREQLRAT